MQVDLIAGSDSNSYALFDPAALEPFPPDAPDDEWPRWFERQSAAGRLLECLRSNGMLELKLLVDEPFQHAAPHERKDVLDGAILRVPSGRLYLRGIEFVHAEDEQERREAEADAEPDPQRAGVPAGTYRVTAFRAAYRVPQAQRDEEVRAQLGPGDFEYVRAVDKRAVPIGCAFVLFALVGVAAFLFSASSWTWRLGAAAIAVGIVFVTLAVMFRLLTSPPVTRVREAEVEVDRRYPTTVVMLRRLSDDQVPDTFPPARFGIADEDQPE